MIDLVWIGLPILILMDSILADAGPGESLGSRLLLVVLFSSLSLIMFSVLAFYWSQSQSIGKRLLRLRVILEDGSGAGLRRTVTRSSLKLTGALVIIAIANFLPGTIRAPFLVGCLAVIAYLSARPWTWWDAVMRTRVLQVPVEQAPHPPSAPAK